MVNKKLSLCSYDRLFLDVDSFVSFLPSLSSPTEARPASGISACRVSHQDPILHLGESPTITALRPIMFNPYNVLELDASATREDVNKAYKRLALRFHPDKNLNNTEEANRKMVQINTAYEQLTQQQFRSTPAPSNAKPSQRGTRNDAHDKSSQEQEKARDTYKMHPRMWSGVPTTVKMARSDLQYRVSAIDAIIQSFKNRGDISQPTIFDDLLLLQRHIRRTDEQADELLRKIQRVGVVPALINSSTFDQIVNLDEAYGGIFMTIRPWVNNVNTDPNLDLKLFARILANTVRLVRETRRLSYRGRVRFDRSELLK